MIKIEKLRDGAKATIMRNGVKQAIYETMRLSYSEFETIEVTTGSVIYSVDEQVVKEVSANTPVVPLKESPKSAQQNKIAVDTATKDTETVAQEKVTVKPVIIKPVSKTTKK